MGVLGLLTGLTAISTGGSKVEKAKGPPINAQSPDEESFIKYVFTDAMLANASFFYEVQSFLTLCRDFLKNAEGGEKSIAEQAKAAVKH